jgi:hypothetical protein
MESFGSISCFCVRDCSKLPCSAESPTRRDTPNFQFLICTLLIINYFPVRFFKSSAPDFDSAFLVAFLFPKE